MKTLQDKLELIFLLEKYLENKLRSRKVLSEVLQIKAIF